MWCLWFDLWITVLSPSLMVCFVFVATMNGSVKCTNFLVSLHSRRATVKPSRNQSAATADTRPAVFLLRVLWSFSQLSWQRTSYNTVSIILTLWRPLLPYGYNYDPVLNRVRPSFAIFDIGALWHSALSTECPDVNNYKWRLNPVLHRLLYSCTVPIWQQWASKG